MRKSRKEASIPEWMTKAKTNLIQKDPPPKDYPLQLKTKNMFNYDRKNSNSTEQRRKLFLAWKPQIFPEDRKNVAKEEMT